MNKKQLIKELKNYGYFMEDQKEYFEGNYKAWLIYKTGSTNIFKSCRTITHVQEFLSQVKESL